MLTVVASDPPWKFGDRLAGKTRGAERQYRCLTVPEIVDVMRPALPESGPAVLFLWRVAAMQREAFAVVDALGFTVKTEVVWRKLTRSGKPWFGMGRYVRASHETCLIATRGRGCFPELRNVRSVFEAQVREHSRKPEEFYDLIEALYPRARYVEIFARAQRDGWACHGDQVGTFKARRRAA